MYLYNCTCTCISNLLIITDVDINGHLLVNMKLKTEVTNLTVKVNKLILKSNRLFTNGIIIYYCDNCSYDYNILMAQWIQQLSHKCFSKCIVCHTYTANLQC